MPNPSASSTALRLTGSDVLPLLHRISTNALLDLAQGQARATLFCDFRGRLLHRAVAYHAGDGAVWLLRDDAPGAELALFVDRHVFREQVAIEDRSAELSVTRGAATNSSEQGGIPRDVVTERDALHVASGPDSRPGERDRIAAARPAHGHEIVEEFNPFEVGLGDEVHLDKGCYTGQEALQRLTTYNSVRRRLARVRGDGPLPATPAELTWRGARAGWLTSVAEAAGGSAWVGLAVVKIECLESGEIPELAGRPLSAAPESLDAPRALGRP